MIIEEPEGFKTWLTAKLEPLCDADPAALAKYVYALVKKDKPIEELKNSMLEQLEIFLQKETKGFVDLLFTTLEKGDFELKQISVAKSVNSLPQSDVDLRDSMLVSSTSHHDVSKKDSHKELVSSGTSQTSGGAPFGPTPILNSNPSRKESFQDKQSRKSESEERGRLRSRRRCSSISPDRRRSRSYERRRSRDGSRAWRNKSPPSRKYDRRRSYSKSPMRRHSRSRSPPAKRGRYRNRSPPRSHSRSISPRTSLDREMKSPLRERDTDLRLGTNLNSVVSISQTNELPFPTKRCRDFDEKGYCMRGDMCPYDHGKDPVVLDDLPSSVMFNGQSQNPLLTAASQLIHESSPTNLEYNPAAPSLEPRIWRKYTRSSALMHGANNRAVGNSRGGFMGGHKRELISVVTGSPDHKAAGKGISGPGSGPPYRNTRSHDVNNGLGGKNIRYQPYGRGGASRLGGPPSLPPPSANSTLHVKKVPLHLNNISHLNNHFSKFGKIVNILVGFEGDSESALITFSTHSEANLAYKSTEAVLNNRFIKVFWYNPGNNNENKPDNMAPISRPSVLERLGAPPAQKVLNSLQPNSVQQQRVTLSHNNNISKTIFVPNTLKKENISENFSKDNAVKKKEENAIKEIKKRQEAQKERLKQSVELRKKKQVLLEKQLNQQKLLIQKLEGTNITSDKKTTIMSTIKSLQESIEELKKDLAEDVEASLSSISGKKPRTKETIELFRKTKEETQRELLDAEMDLLKQEQQGKDINELKKKISDLKLKAFQMKLPIFRSSTPYTRGRGSFRVRGGRGAGRRGAVAARGAARFSYNSLDYNVVDHRPTKLLVSGYEQDDKAEVLAHFNQFGEISNYSSDDATPSLVLNFKSRKEAELALQKGKNFQDRLLSVTWATPNHNIRPGVTTQNTPSLQEDQLCDDEIFESAEDEDEFVGLSPVDILLLEDEEENEEEERTWRR